MKLYLPLLLSTLSGIAAFIPPSPNTHSTALFKTLGFDTSDLYTKEEVKRKEIFSEVSYYVRKLRSKITITPLGKTTLVSGFDPADPSASMVLDFLNSEEAKMYFPFDKIVAHVADGKSAKKRMIGRNARYTGLLDKLEFSEGETMIPSAEQLEGVNSWVAHVAGGDMDALGKVVDAAEAAESINNVAVLVSGAGSLGQQALKDMEEMMKSKATSFKYTVVVVPEWNDVPEAQCAYGVVNVTDVAESGPFSTGESFSREESLRIVTECLAMEGAKGKCVVANSFPDKNSVEGMLIQSMREAGFSRIEEVGMMVMNGLKGCMQLIEEEKKPKGLPKDTRTPEEIKADMEKAAELRAKEIEQWHKEQDEKDRNEKLEVIAKEWAEREFFRKSLKGQLIVNKKQFVEMIWDRAMFEANITLRNEEGVEVDEEKEREEWRVAQKKRAKAEMAAAMKRLSERVDEEIASY